MTGGTHQPHNRFGGLVDRLPRYGSSSSCPANSSIVSCRRLILSTPFPLPILMWDLQELPQIRLPHPPRTAGRRRRSSIPANRTPATRSAPPVCSCALRRLPGTPRRIGTRRVTAGVDGGHMSSDRGGLLLREVDRRIGLTARLAACSVDHRHPARVEHDLRTLLAQRVYRIGARVRESQRSRRAAPRRAVLAGDGAPTLILHRQDHPPARNPVNTTTRTRGFVRLRVRS